MSDNVKVVLLGVIVGLVVTLTTIAYYWAGAQEAPIRACERLEDQQLVADCLRGVAP